MLIRLNTTRHTLMKLPAFTVIERMHKIVFVLCSPLLIILPQPGAGADVGSAPRTSNANEARILADLQERQRAGKWRSRCCRRTTARTPRQEISELFRSLPLCWKIKILAPCQRTSGRRPTSIRSCVV